MQTAGSSLDKKGSDSDSSSKSSSQNSDAETDNLPRPNNSAESDSSSDGEVKLFSPLNRQLRKAEKNSGKRLFRRRVKKGLEKSPSSKSTASADTDETSSRRQRKLTAANVSSDSDSSDKDTEPVDQVSGESANSTEKEIDREPVVPEAPAEQDNRVAENGHLSEKESTVEGCRLETTDKAHGLASVSPTPQRESKNLSNKKGDESQLSDSDTQSKSRTGNKRRTKRSNSAKSAKIVNLVSSSDDDHEKEDLLLADTGSNADITDAKHDISGELNEDLLLDDEAGSDHTAATEPKSISNKPPGNVNILLVVISMYAFRP